MYSEARGEEVTKVLSLALIETPCNNRREQRRDNFAHYVLSDDDMKQCAKRIQDGLERGGHGSIPFN